MNGQFRYSYELRGPLYCIYDGGTKIAEICEYGDKAKAIAANMVKALNSREKYLATIENKKYGVL